MNTLLIVAVIVLLFVALVALRNTIRKSVQRNSIATALETLKNTETYQFMQQLQNAMGVNATQHGKVPDAYGEFGHDATNPIPTKGIPGSIAYLAKLRTEDGQDYHSWHVQLIMFVLHQRGKIAYNTQI